MPKSKNRVSRSVACSDEKLIMLNESITFKVRCQSVLLSLKEMGFTMQGSHQDPDASHSFGIDWNVFM